MKARISHVVDYGYKKELHLSPVEEDSFIQGYVGVGEGHPWFNAEVGQTLILKTEND